MKGLREYGFGATVFERSRPASATFAGAGADERQAGAVAPAAASFGVKLELENFYCHRAVGDQWGGKGETYWASATGSDKQVGPGFISQEFGSRSVPPARSRCRGLRDA
ncbi:hypothetical protein [Streptosporangium nondiastaticum]|uniref:hypothetical protein n=1 Tax=Streptosporangium nondiastaticum TaxID=35764 RepID=UPI00167427A7|nr:hypothetical protein [Streptosporangium nondiastaticum]